LLAHVLMAKYGDGLPLYRQAAMLARIIHDPLRVVDFPPPFSAETNS
jgi:hypothetical protein